MATKIVPKICPFCESSCGLRVEVDTAAQKVVRISGDPDHPGSRGYLCPKSQGLNSLRADPDRLTRPLLREGDRFREISWSEALDRAAAGIKQVTARHGSNAMGLYSGNPQAHVAALQMCVGALLGVMPALYTNSGSIDCYPRFLVGAYLYGNIGHVPVPDIERTDFFLIFGGNPVVSNGSMMGAPNMPDRLKRLRQRGGTLVVVDPRRTETAKAADDHFAITPGTDALLALAMIDTLFREDLVDCKRLASHVRGLERLRQVAARFDADRVAPLTRIAAPRIRQLARDFTAAGRAAAYSRVGTNCQTFGTLGVWAVDCLNVLTGNLDEEGGVMFPSGAMPQFMHMPYEGTQPPHGRWRSRVSGTAELGGTMPTQVLWEEIETPGEGQIKGLVIIAGNPVLSNANANRVSQTLASLDFMVAVDIYLNETTRHADIILPPIDHLQRSEFTMIWNNWMVEDIISYSPQPLERDPESLDDWEIVTGLAARLADADPAAFERQVAQGYVDWLRDRLPRLPEGMSATEALDRATGDTYPERIYDVILRGGPSGDGFAGIEGGLSLDRLKENAAGISGGPMRAGRFPDAIDTPDGKIDIAADIFIADIERLDRSVVDGKWADGTFRLVGRRHLRSNNSWMRNLTNLAKGPPRCTVMINPDDAEGLSVAEGDMIRLKSRVGEITLPVQITQDVGRGVLCAPHGWSDRDPVARLSVAYDRQSANFNVLSDDGAFDAPSGGATFNGTPVEVEAVRPSP